jgi:hypothetical protein
VSNADAATITEAIAAQVRLDAAPLWDRDPAAVVFYTDASAVPAEAHGIAIVDTIQDQPQGVLGFHTEDQGGKLWGVVAAKPELDNGRRRPATGAFPALSHEVLEMLSTELQPVANNGSGVVYSFQVCDPVRPRP